MTDETLRQYLAQGFSQNEIAKLCKVSQPAISKRIKALEAKALTKAPAHAIRAAASLWSIKDAAEENYQRALELLAECETASDKTRVVGEIRQHLAFAMQVIETLSAAEETRAFMEEVLAVIADVDPAARDQIVTRLREKRTIRAAFLPH